ncbi:hypothetical protein [Actinomycetospora termitidis]|uniref:DUF732 domain-containing protein n=1 Tax=Actinomycetospora termitidis TaxID=3053470 RepID=A0ABT7MG23_9PSEU|nr:hypothetical protein [Actinomycetospora sp. Odt1-22]MDL5159618.1 hypothetical protein [Actinomycetospora sp. Odt1-22]
MTATLDPADDTAPDSDEHDPPVPGVSPLRYVLLIGLAVFVLLAALAGVVLVVLNDPPPSPVSIVEVAPPSTGSGATATPEERFLAAWHAAAPGVAARRSDDYWSRLGVATCNMIGRPFINEEMVVRVLGSSPQVMSFDEGRTFLDVSHAELCAQNEYGPQLQSPTVRPVPPITLPDFGSSSSRSGGGSSSIPTVRVSPPSVGRAPTIPGAGSGGGSSGSGGSSSRPDVQPFPGNPLQPQPVG